MPFGLGSWGSTPRRSISDDWVRALPSDRSETFQALAATWNSLYAMMSVSLDEAISLRARGDLVCAREQILVATELFDRLCTQLATFNEVIPQYSRCLKNFPEVRPLRSSFFRGTTCQSAASWNGFFHWVLFRNISRFHYKIRLLSDTVRRLEPEFRQATMAIAKASFADNRKQWTTLDCLHYDITTCLRENEVLLKSFLRALPAQYLPAFSADMGVPLAGARVGLSEASA